VNDSASASRAPLSAPPTVLAGVGPARAAALANLGIHDLRGLLCFLPRRVAWTGERRTAQEAGELAPDTEVAVVGKLRRLRLFRNARRRSILALEIADASGALKALFFNQPWLFERLRALAASGKDVELLGRIGRAKDGPALLAPRLIEEPPRARVRELEPVYPSTEGLGQELLRRWVRSTLVSHGDALDEPLAPSLLRELGLDPLPKSARALHEPTSPEAFARARRRIVFERLLALQARLVQTAAARADERARPLVLEAPARAALLAAWPFAPTAGQARVLAEILADLAKERPMRRLLQGEVGAGKTLVAITLCAAVARAGGQAALLAPTELLAEQHHLGLHGALERFGLRAVLVSGSQRAAERRAALAALASGAAELAIGTHALLSPTVRFQRLDLVVIDEQQRFGVAQKRALLEQEAGVHALLMTATPIPRTLALCYYGDLEASQLRERPAGRGSVTTRVVGMAERAEVLARVAERVKLGERAYWVCPRIVPEEEDELAAEDERGRESSAERVSAERTFAALAAGPLAAAGLALLHGRLAAAERAAAIERFRTGAARVLVSTSMVEVGVDVPEATVMVIEAAERFGSSQLHQLRGRIGRSARPSWCFLFASAFPNARLSVLEDCSDGFRIAEDDLARRGMGDLAGLRQAGENLEGLAPEELELALVERARTLVRADPALAALYRAQRASAALV
jgi:ATP-dependent DNA helicase RecG